MSAEREKWVKFFYDAGIPSGPTATYALKFCDHRIKNDMLADLDKAILHDMGIAVMGDVIAILKHAKAVHAKCERDKLESEYIGQHKVSGLVSSRMEIPPVQSRPAAIRRTPPVSTQPATSSPPVPVPRKIPQTKPVPKSAPPKTPEIIPKQTVEIGTKRKATVVGSVVDQQVKGNERTNSRNSKPATKLSSSPLPSSPVKTVTVTKKSLSDRFSSFPESSKLSESFKYKEPDVTIRVNKSAFSRLTKVDVPQKKPRYMQESASKAGAKVSSQSTSVQKQKQAAVLVSKAAKTTAQKKSVFDRLGAELGDKPTGKPTPSLSTGVTKALVNTPKSTDTEAPKYKSLKPLKKVTVVKTIPPEEKTLGSVFSRLGAGPDLPQQLSRAQEPSVSQPLWEDDDDDYVMDYSSHSVLQPSKLHSASRSRTSGSIPVKPVKPLRRLAQDDDSTSSVFRRLGNKV